MERAEVTRGTTSDVYVANHHTTKTAEQADEEAHRYQHLFNDPQRVHYTGMSFPEFATGGMRSLDGR
jgi:hypothetical protein